MQAQTAYIAVILIWSTTPLAVKWSSEGPGFLLGALGRMLIAAMVCLLLLVLLGKSLPWHRAAQRTYAAALLGVFGSMLCVYWGAQYIPSGIVAVLFGMTPILTGVFARLWLNERSLTPARLVGMLLGLTGLGIIFGEGAEFGARAGQGIAAVLTGVLLHSASTVLVKRADSSLPGMAVTTGTLLLSVPLYLLAWLILDGHPPEAVPVRASAAIVYLGLVGSVAGFTLYYHVLRHMTASAVGLIPLVAPVLALLLGTFVNGETISHGTWSGVLHILMGLMLYQWGHLLGERLPARTANGKLPS